MYEIFEQLLKRRDVTPYRVHKETGVAQSTLSDWKNGKTIPGVESMQKIADYFNVSLDYLTGRNKKEKPSADKGEELTFDDFTYALFNETGELTDENKEKLLEMARFFKEQQLKNK